MMATQPAQAPKGQTYGQAGQQLAAQKAQPVAGAPSPGKGAAGEGGPSGTMPGQIPSLSDPSAFPDEPVTAGVGSGPGPGPEALTSGDPNSQELAVLKTIFQRYPTDDLRRLIEYTEMNVQPQEGLGLFPDQGGIPPLEEDPELEGVLDPEFAMVEEEPVPDMPAENPADMSIVPAEEPLL